jgi:hypothetical protein
MSALQKAVEGANLSPTQQKGALNQAIDKLSSMKKRADGMKESVSHGVGLGVNAAEVHGANFAVSAIAAAGGEKVTHPMGLPVDTRAILGGGLTLWGLWDAFNGGDGSHQVALGTGVASSYVSELGQTAGKAIAEKWAKPADAAPNSPPAIPQTAQDPTAAQGGGGRRRVRMSHPGHGDGEHRARRRIRG